MISCSHSSSQNRSRDSAFQIFDVLRCPLFRQSVVEVKVVGDLFTFPSSPIQDDGLLKTLESVCSTAGDHFSPHDCSPPVDTANLQCMCNISDMYLLSAAVSHVISRIVTQYRACIPHQAWYHVCSNFAVMLTKGHSVSAQKPSCVGTNLPADGYKEQLSAIKAVVMQHIARTLLTMFRTPPNSLASMSWGLQDTHSWEVAREARMHVLFGTWSLTQVQTFKDAPSLMRRLTVVGPAQMSYCSAEEKNIALFSLLRLSERQKVQLSRMWSQWQSSRRALDDAMVAALGPLVELQTADDIPALAIRSITACCTGDHGWLAGCHLSEAGSAVLRSAGHWGSKLLGINPGSVVEAEQCLKKLKAVHKRDALLLDDFVATISAPGVVLTTRQLAMFCLSCVNCCVPLVDVLRLAQTAAIEEKRMMLLRPFVLSNPSTMAIGNSM